MHISHDLNPVTDISIENQIVPDGKVPDTYRDVIPCRARFRTLCKHAGFLVEKV